MQQSIRYKGLSLTPDEMAVEKRCAIPLRQSRAA